MTGLRTDQVTKLVLGVYERLDRTWQRPRGRRRVLGLYRR
jgi:hypothetical protein